MSAVDVRNLTKTFPRHGKALNDVSFSVERGEMVALIGASGSGKSTLIRHIAGLLPADRAKGCCSISVFGTCVQDSGRIAGDIVDQRAQIGVIFQQFNLVGRLSLLKNVALGALGRMPAWRGCLGLFGADEKRLAMEALHRVGISHLAGQRADRCSGGQQQRAAIARTMVQRAELVLADEPIASLDPVAARRVMENLAAINREDRRTVIVSLHQVHYATAFCTRTIALNHGTIVYDGPSSELGPEQLRELYGSESEDLILPDAYEGREKRATRPRHEDMPAAARTLQAAAAEA